ncbi:sigma 54-interacting transcriptional regulator [Sporosalibacterium faouarense]|uniref:sigma 54-interacting transcriptional regulator n=1 Tax=Sporosalibacterium faouarense TaxID=516123 RepID=UPI00192C0904|nr:sigma-54-dependent transcriptional regulator [Sporosalibacterium faouarense]
MKMIDKVYETLILLEKRNDKGISTLELSSYLENDRTNISRYLNQLHKEEKIEKIEGRPVLFKSKENTKSNIDNQDNNRLDSLVGSNHSLSIPIQKAKAAILYPPRGLHTLILGETGTGKSMFAECMYRFAIESQVISRQGPFIRFNCADYADNPQLVISQIFGVKKGAYTGAERDKTGLLKKSDGGIFFLDEVHRLSPQGQEMLFTYIDKGYFRPLGETEKLTRVKVQIIAATTEDPDSHLLKTFTRRIAMTITLPSLKERSLVERYYLIEDFIKEESKRVGRSIYINKNSLISYLLYDCPNNIGQLKSDIQLACAKAFVNFKSRKEDYILITVSDVPQHVKKGLMQIKDSREKIEELLKDKGDVLKYYHKENRKNIISQNLKEEEDFYSIIERKFESLQKVGMNEKEVNEILNIDIESYFHKYIGKLSKKVSKEELLSVVSSQVIDLVEEILAVAEKRLSRKYDDKIFLALSLHLSRTIERIKKGNKIYNPKLNSIRINYEKEFLLSMQLAKTIDEKLQIETPVDEIGYLAMFLISTSYKPEVLEGKKVRIIVIMHGNSTATSMAEVANNLLSIDDVIGLDMSLNTKPEEMYEITKEKIKSINNENGVLLLVDMGSLTNFGDMISEDTGIMIKTIDMVSTAIVIDAARKAVMGHGITEIYNSCKGIRMLDELRRTKEISDKKRLIITVCFTGEGASVKLKDIIKEKINGRRNIDIKALDILEQKKFLEIVERHKEHYNIIAVVGTINVSLRGIPFISAIDIFNNSGIDKINKLIDEEELFLKVGKSLREHTSTVDGEKIVEDVKYIIKDLEENLDISLEMDVKMGVAIHISFLVDKLANGEKTKPFEDLVLYRDKYNYEMNIVKKSIKPLEVNYKINIGDDEIAYISKLLLFNSNREIE